MNKRMDLLFAVAMTSSSLEAGAVWGMSPDGYIGNFHGSAAVCKDIMSSAVADGLKFLKSRFAADGINEISTFQHSDGYKKAYKEEVDRLTSLSVEERREACEWNWGPFR